MRLLLNPEHDFPANKAGETPLYLAAESGFYAALIEILNVCEESTHVAGPLNRTPLHAAVIQKHTGKKRYLIAIFFIYMSELIPPLHVSC